MRSRRAPRRGFPRHNGGMRISKQIHVEGRYHVAIMNPHERSDGAVLLPVVCWMVVTTKDEEGDAADSIVPFIVSPDSDDGALIPATLYDEDDFISIVSPGDETHRIFDDVATERLKTEQEIDNREHNATRAQEIRDAIDDHPFAVLKNINQSKEPGEGRELPISDALVELLSYELIVATRHQESPRPIRWYSTSLGREVAHLDRAEA